MKLVRSRPKMSKETREWSEELRQKGHDRWPSPLRQAIAILQSPNRIPCGGDGWPSWRRSSPPPKISRWATGRLLLG